MDWIPVTDGESDSVGEDPHPLLKGTAGGVIGTVTMSVYRAPLFEGLPPTAEFWARFLGEKEPSAYTLQALVLHLLYGAGAGSVFGFLFSRAWVEGSGKRGSRATASGLVYGLLLSVFGSSVLLRRLLDIDMTGREALVFHVGHAVYGLALGTWVGTENRVGRSKED